MSQFRPGGGLDGAAFPIPAGAMSLTRYPRATVTPDPPPCTSSAIFG
jgi:hypothetical protein